MKQLNYDKKQLVIDWNANSASSEEEKAKIKADIEKLSPQTLNKSIQKLNDAMKTVRSNLNDETRQRVTKYKVLQELKQ